jgi:hypothetical protein
MTEAYAGIDVAFAKQKRLPIAVCVLRGAALEPLPLRSATPKPPRGKGNAKAIDQPPVEAFAEETAKYLKAIEASQAVTIRRVAIDAPSNPKRPEDSRRECERSLDAHQIRCIATPSAAEFKKIRARVRKHLADGGAESRIPSANQLWMLVGFALFKRLRLDWECLEVFPQAIAAVLEAHDLHKSRPGGVEAQLAAAARHTGWPTRIDRRELAEIGFGSQADRLDAYLAAWVASLDDCDRQAWGRPPCDAIWVPKLRPTA